MPNEVEDTKASTVIESPEELLAHALAMETEAAEHYTEIAENLELHNNQEVADLFRKLGEYGRLHAAEVQEISKDMVLPHIAPWDFKWPEGTGDSPEASALEETHYLMTSYQAVQLAMKVESSAYQFYADVAATTPNAETKRIASEFAEEESEHVELLKGWVEKYPKPDDDWDYDPDPPRSLE
ncbi:MAG: ferritin family protein [Rhodospirillales bacterium]|nr:ferritin family protein [Rhodospirillales bacterium]